MHNILFFIRTASLFLMIPGYYAFATEPVPDLIPEDRCIRAIYLDKTLAKERDVKHWEEWDPPITDFMARWLDAKRLEFKIKLEFCDETPL